MVLRLSYRAILRRPGASCSSRASFGSTGARAGRSGAFKLANANSRIDRSFLVSDLGVTRPRLRIRPIRDGAVAASARRPAVLLFERPPLCDACYWRLAAERLRLRHARFREINRPELNGRDGRKAECLFGHLASKSGHSHRLLHEVKAATGDLGRSTSCSFARHSHTSSCCRNARLRYPLRQTGNRRPLPSGGCSDARKRIDDDLHGPQMGITGVLSAPPSLVSRG